MGWCFEKRTVFAKDLILPRKLLCLEDGQVIIGETDTLDLYLYEDTNGDGVSDKKTLVYKGGPRGWQHGASTHGTTLEYR